MGGHRRYRASTVGRILPAVTQVAGVARQSAQCARILFCYYADFTHDWEINRAVQAIASDLGEIDLSIYAAGSDLTGKVELLPLVAWHEMLAVNLTGAVACTRASLPILTEKAHLFYLSALLEKITRSDFSAYTASKAGLEAFVQILAQEQPKKRVTWVRPSAVDTPFWNNLPMTLPKRHLTPAMVAQAITAAYSSAYTGRLDV